MSISDIIKQRLFEAEPRGRAIILGLGVSNLPLAEMLTNMGATVCVRDAKSLDALGEHALALSARGVEFVCGADPTIGLAEEKDIHGSVIFRSPGIRPDAGELPEAVRRGALLTSEMEWFCDATPASVIAVTGSDGKTTTTTLTYLLLSEAAKRRGGRVYVGGNIGTPLLDKAATMSAADYAVLELSSFQLMTMHGTAQRAAITNITPNHLNWHTGMEEYTRAKYNVSGKDTRLLVLNAKSPAAAAAADSVPDFNGSVIYFSAYTSSYEETVPKNHRQGAKKAGAVFLRGDSIIFSDGNTEEELLRRSDIKLPGLHNVENYMTAAALTRGLIDREELLQVARTFGGVEHRIEFVRELDGVKYYNSSIDSTPTRTEAALSVFDCRPVFILCGRDKHVPFESLAAALFNRAGGVVVSGEAIPVIRAAIEAEAERRGSYGELRVAYEDDFCAAIDRARELAKPGSAVVLSPSCTSFDRFRNFEERGRVFKDYVNQLK